MLRSKHMRLHKPSLVALAASTPILKLSLPPYLSSYCLIVSVCPPQYILAYFDRCVSAVAPHGKIAVETENRRGRSCKGSNVNNQNARKGIGHPCDF